MYLEKKNNTKALVCNMTFSIFPFQRKCLLKSIGKTTLCHTKAFTIIFNYYILLLFCKIFVEIGYRFNALEELFEGIVFVGGMDIVAA